MRRGVWGALVMLSCATTPRPADRLIAEDIMDRVLLEKTELGRCVAQQRQRDPRSTGKVLLRWRILPSGEPRDVHAISDGPPELLSCLVAVFETMRYRQVTTRGDPIVFPIKY